MQRCSHDCAWTAVVDTCVMLEHSQGRSVGVVFTRLLARCGVWAPEAELLGLAAFLCFTGAAAAGRLLPANSSANMHSHLLPQ